MLPLPLLLLLSACSGGASDDPDGATGAWAEFDPARASAAEAGRLARADAARAELFQRLSGRLQEAVAADGPAEAIAVCRDEAPAMATAVGAELGVRIGRSGVRLRNAANTAPAWAAEAVAAGSAERRAWRDGDGRVAVLSPILTAAQCLVCHGAADALGLGVADALAEHYPGDTATGFAEGELRGWFWVEVPAAD